MRSFIYLVILTLGSCSAQESLEERTYKFYNDILEKKFRNNESLIYEKIYGDEYSNYFLYGYIINKTTNSTCPQKRSHNFKLNDSLFYVNQINKPPFFINPKRLNSNIANKIIRDRDLSFSADRLKKFEEEKKRGKLSSFGLKMRRLSWWKDQNNVNVQHIARPIFSRDFNYAFLLNFHTQVNADIYEFENGSWQFKCNVEYEGSLH